MEIITVSSSFLWAVVGLVFLIYLIFSIVLNYHWKNYANDSETVKRVKKMYFSVSISILALSVLSAFIYTYF